jgi:hypothetical protein
MHKENVKYRNAVIVIINLPRVSQFHYFWGRQRGSCPTTPIAPSPLSNPGGIQKYVSGEMAVHSLKTMDLNSRPS